MLTYQDQIVRMTHKALDDLLRAVEALPEDKRDWKPGPTGRSALDQLQECALVPMLYSKILQEREAPSRDDHVQFRRQAKELKTFEACREAAMTQTSAFCALVLDFPDEDLEFEMNLPFNGGMNLTLADLVALHYWNLSYHLGQVNYIQTLLGDPNMH
ncbi:MAG: DinB family protein [Fimbriimonadaceae bacterium]|nr:DinB family protein [Fimbriimonadaceae bacterium]